MPIDTSERGLERLICTALAGHPCEPPASGTVAEPPAGYGGVGWSGGNPHDYDREYGVDVVQLRAFLQATQPEAADTLALHENGPTRRRFLARLQGEVSRRGTIDVLRHGLKHGPHQRSQRRVNGNRKRGESMTDWSKCPAVESVPGRVSGNWVFKNTRLPVYALFENLAEGATVCDFIEWFGGVEESEVKAVLEHVAQELRAKVADAHPVR